MSSEILWNRTVPARRRAKKPTPKEWGMPNHPSPLMSRRDYENHSAWFSGFRIDLIPAPSHELPCSGWSRFRPRLQWRVRDGFAPSSLILNKNRLNVGYRVYQASLACQENTRKMNYCHILSFKRSALAAFAIKISAQSRGDYALTNTITRTKNH